MLQFLNSKNDNKKWKCLPPPPKQEQQQNPAMILILCIYSCKYKRNIIKWMHMYCIVVIAVCMGYELHGDCWLSIRNCMWRLSERTLLHYRDTSDLPPPPATLSPLPFMEVGTSSISPSCDHSAQQLLTPLAKEWEESLFWPAGMKSYCNEWVAAFFTEGHKDNLVATGISPTPIARSKSTSGDSFETINGWPKAWGVGQLLLVLSRWMLTHGPSLEANYGL